MYLKNFEISLINLWTSLNNLWNSLKIFEDLNKLRRMSENLWKYLSLNFLWKDLKISGKSLNISENLWKFSEHYLEILWQKNFKIKMFGPNVMGCERYIFATSIYSIYSICRINYPLNDEFVNWMINNRCIDRVLMVNASLVVAHDSGPATPGQPTALVSCFNIFWIFQMGPYWFLKQFQYVIYWSSCPIIVT